MTLLRGAELAAAFDDGARAYDRLVALNPGYHSQLRRSARRLGLTGGGAGRRVLDLGCGTGASTAALVSVLPRAEVVGIDASAGMLERARSKPWPRTVTFVRATVEDLSAGVVDGPFDVVFAAYVFRNVADPDAALHTVHQLLVPGGRIAVHDYTLSGRCVDRVVWTVVYRTVVLPLGSLTGDRRLYRHLRHSVDTFDTAPAFGDRLRRSGFDQVRVLPLPGWQTGITHTFLGRRPERETDGDS
ncbi:methyltransferase domain-containing protein [Streptomyces sp. NPDC026672]|uniref:methyltransferase domain-containing protein n=1 Tax=unclassified Streptomyces TaxID=2593676 RepID=UPI0033EDDC17